MNCPSCHEQTKEPLTCNQCGSTFCRRCNPYFDHETFVCQACQERNSIEAIRDDAWTEKLRRWFNKAAPLPEKPALIHPLPWTVERDGHYWYIMAGSLAVGEFKDLPSAQYACDAANAYYELSMVSALTYNRIRAGDPFWNGGKSDCELWQRVRKLLH